MANQQSDRNQKAKKPMNDKPAETNKPLSQLKPGSPMDKFNNALRKILSVPKKDIKKK